MDVYQCDRCGACCQGHLIVEADDLDVLREPRLIDVDPHHAGQSVERVVDGIRKEWKAVHLAVGYPCAFLDERQHCSIYPTRPNVCVAMEAGDEQCQEARQAAGLPPLPPLELYDIRLPNLPVTEQSASELHERTS